MLCFILAGQFERLTADYAACMHTELFQATDQDCQLPFLVWQLYYCACGQYSKACLSGYETKRLQFKKTEFAFGYEHLLAALVAGDGALFSQQLQSRADAFARRQRSRKDDALWGYGGAGRDCFDVLGTAICRLAWRRGMQFTPVPERFYPPLFWQGE
ncbi:hypothetical protein V8J88_16360 [Massilia sp. W12]|uniref:hypothetical protein n=1 Tax=Massilia sp. W12 TaxID=3126507 RepID=UPI0030D5E839